MSQVPNIVNGDPVDSIDWNAISEEFSEADSLHNDMIVRLAELEFENNLDNLNYNGGFFDIFADTDKLLASAGQDGFEDGDYTSSPTWSEELTEDTGASVNVQSTTVLNGSNALNMQIGGSETFDDYILGYDSGGVDFSKITVVFWVRADSGSEGTAGLFLRNTINGVRDGNDCIGINFTPRFGDAQFRTTDGAGSIIAQNSIHTTSADIWYRYEIEIDKANTEATVTAYDENDNQLGQVTQGISSASTWKWVTIGTRDSSTQAVNFYFDDETYDIATGTNVTVTTGTDGDIKLDSGATSGTVSSIDFDLSSDLSEAPNTAVLSQNFENQDANNDAQYVLTDGDGNSKTINQADIDTEVDVSNFTSTTVNCKVELSRVATSDPNPTIEDYSIHFKV